MAPPRSLPAVPRTLFGRDDALALLRDALVPGRVTALVGPPGVGKSTLLAALVADRGDAAWVGLAHASTPADLWAALGAALGVSFARAEDAGAQVVAALAKGPLAVVALDAAEHLDAAAWDEVARLERAAPDVAWAVTSVVRPAGVRVLELGPLAQADAVALLVTRVQERALDARVDAADPVWSALAERLGGLPLALELAAGRFGVLTPAQILERLDRPRLLAGGRHGTLDGALRYAWDLLGAEDRAALAACAVFRGGFDLPAAEAVLGEDALDRLTALRERSALAWRDGRFHVFDGLRRIAEAEGGEGLRNAEARHRAWFAEQGQALRRASHGADAVRAAAALRVERPNLEAAWARAAGDPLAAARIAVGIVASVRIHGPHWGADLLGDPVPLARAVGGDAGVELLTEWSAHCRYQDRMEEAQAAADAAVALAETLGDAALLGSALWELAGLYAQRGEKAKSRAYAVRCVEIAPDPYRRGIGLGLIGSYDFETGNYAGTRTHIEAAVRAFREAGSVRALATGLANLGILGVMQRRHDEALARFDDALATHLQVFRPAALELTVRRAILQLLRGHRDLAAEDLARAEALRIELAVPALEGFVRFAAGLLRWANGDREGARACFAEAAPRLSTSAPCKPGTVAAFAAAAAAGPNLRAELAAAREAGGLPDLLDVLDAWAAGEPLPPPPAWESPEAQVARRFVGGAVTWRVDAEGRWFERPNGRVDLSRRGPLRRILAALLAARRERPGSGLTVDDLFAAGWPGESALPEAASARVYTAVRELRALGLEPVLRRRAEGYLLDPGVEIALG